MRQICPSLCGTFTSISITAKELQLLGPVEAASLLWSIRCFEPPISRADQSKVSRYFTFVQVNLMPQLLVDGIDVLKMSREGVHQL